MLTFLSNRRPAPVAEPAVVVSTDLDDTWHDLTDEVTVARAVRDAERERAERIACRVLGIRSA